MDLNNVFFKKIKKFKELNHCFFLEKVVFQKEFIKALIADKDLKIVKIILKKFNFSNKKDES